MPLAGIPRTSAMPPVPNFLTSAEQDVQVDSAGIVRAQI
jgi:hypothetical protein